MVTRRSFTFGGLTLPFLAEGSLARGTGPAPVARPLIVILSGIEAGTPFARLSAFCEAFLNQGICITLGLSFRSGEGAGFSQLAQDLRQLADANPNFVEIAIDAGEIASADPYWQLRQASTLQAQFTKSLNPAGNIFVEPLLMAMTLLTSTPARGMADLGNMRAAGIRTVIHLKPQFTDERNLDPGYWLAGTGLRHAFVSATATSAGALLPPALDPAVDGLVAKSGPVIYNIPLSSAGTLSDADLPAYAREIAQQLRAGTAVRRLRAALPHTVYMQSQSQPSRYIIVRIDDYRVNPNDNGAHVEFTDRLMELGIPMTEAVFPGGAVSIANDAAARIRLASLTTYAGYEAAAHGFNHTPREMAGNTLEHNETLVRESLRAINDATGFVPASFIPPNNAFDNNSLMALSRCGVSNFSAERGDYSWIWGLDKHGLLHASNNVHPEKNWDNDIPLFTPDEMLYQLGGRNDAVLAIHPATLSTPQRRRDCFDLLETLRKLPETELTNFDQYVGKVSQPMPMLQTVRNTRTMVEVIDSRETGFEPPSQASLMEDAATAWQYFDAWQKKFDVLVPGTGWREGKRLEAYPFLTMWDVASLVMAHVAAHRIGLIDDARLDRAAAGIVKFLARSTFKFGKLKLPPAEAPIGRARGQRKGFDSTDTGRLLIALRVLDNVSGGSLGIGKLVAGWDLAAAARDGELHNVARGRFDASQSYSYAHYVERGYRLWGIEIQPAFRETDPLSSMDATLRLIEEMRAKGRIATEPSATEAVELGQSDYGKIMSDMLLAAQIERHRQTGIPTCVSEGPLDRRPWFAYQGYQVMGDGSGEWPVDAPPGGRKYLTAKAVETIRAVSTKGCFLWLAARPGAYSAMLHGLARDRARISGLGFASALLEQNLKPIDLSDVNTNGIILEALAFVLGGRKPLIEFGPENIGPLTELR